MWVFNSCSLGALITAFAGTPSRLTRPVEDWITQAPFFLDLFFFFSFSIFCARRVWETGNLTFDGLKRTSHSPIPYLADERVFTRAFWPLLVKRRVRKRCVCIPNSTFDQKWSNDECISNSHVDQFWPLQPPSNSQPVMAWISESKTIHGSTSKSNSLNCQTWWRAGAPAKCLLLARISGLFLVYQAANEV